jgi:very-short-patch-repair endonuclease
LTRSHRLFIEKWFELTLERIDRNIAEAESKRIFEQAFLRAYWSKYVDLLIAIQNALEKYSSPDGKYELVAQIFGDQMGSPASEIVPDIATRLEWFKRRAAQQFEKDFKALIDLHGVQSPIEQLFLMEWKFLRIEDRHGLKLHLQKRINTDKGDYRVDFLVTNADQKVRLAIELDGHDFHERTKEQAAKDKSRDRAITANDYTVFRFTGSEIAKNPGACIGEIAQFVEGRLPRQRREQ